jgi:multiple antibiotic resistance protein
MLELFLLCAVSLFSIVNPFGAVPLYLAMTPHYENKERNHTVLMTSIYFVLILMTFFFAGNYILSFFGIKVDALRIAGGIVIVNSSFALLNDQFAQQSANLQVQQEAMTKNDISFSPLAMPMLSGPGSISLLIGWYSEYAQWEEHLLITGVILVNGLVVYLVLRLAPNLYKILGVSGLKAGSKIMGFIIMSIGVQSILKGIVSLIKTM